MLRLRLKLHCGAARPSISMFACFTQRATVFSDTPKSRATRARVRPDERATATTSRLNSDGKCYGTTTSFL